MQELKTAVVTAVGHFEGVSGDLMRMRSVHSNAAGGAFVQLTENVNISDNYSLLYVTLPTKDCN